MLILSENGSLTVFDKDQGGGNFWVPLPRNAPQQIQFNKVAHKGDNWNEFGDSIDQMVGEKGILLVTAKTFTVWKLECLQNSVCLYWRNRCMFV